MPVGLFDANHNIISVPKAILRLTDRQTDRVSLVMTVADNPAIVIHHVPPVEGVIPVNMDRRV